MLKQLVNLLLTFLVGLAGNLIAGWIQQDIWSNVFTPTRIVITAVGVGLMILVIAWLENESSSLTNRRKIRKQDIHDSISALDINEKAVLREFFIQRQNIILVPEEDIAVIGLLQKGIIYVVGDSRYLLGVGSVAPVSLTSSATNIIRERTPQIIGFPPGIPTPEQIKKIQELRPGFVWDIERSSW